MCCRSRIADAQLARHELREYLVASRSESAILLDRVSCYIAQECESE